MQLRILVIIKKRSLTIGGRFDLKDIISETESEINNEN